MLKLGQLFVSCPNMKLPFYLILLFTVNLAAQQLKLVKSEALKADTFIGIDSYQHTYWIENNVLHKSGNLGDFVFNNLQLGPISSVDIINPLQVVLFYEDSNTVILLDNRLNETERINFNTSSELLTIGAASNAGNNRLWIFNIGSQQLELYDYRSNRLNVVSQPFEGTLSSMSSNFNNCFVLTDKTITVFNVYGSFISEFTSESYTRITTLGDTILAADKNRLFSLSEDATPKPINTPLDLTIKDLQLTQEFLYIYDGNFLHTFTLTTPK